MELEFAASPGKSSPVYTVLSSAQTSGDSDILEPNSSMASENRQITHLLNCVHLPLPAPNLVQSA